MGWRGLSASGSAAGLRAVPNLLVSPESCSRAVSSTLATVAERNFARRGEAGAVGMPLRLTVYGSMVASKSDAGDLSVNAVGLPIGVGVMDVSFL